MTATTQLHTKLHFAVPSVANIASAIRIAFTGRGATKRVASAADANPRTASTWLYGQAAPRAPELIALMAANEKLEQQIVAMVHELRERHPCPTPPTYSSEALGASASIVVPHRLDTALAS